MFSHIIAFFNYLFPKISEENEDDEKEEFLVGQLLDLEITQDNQKYCEKTESNELPNNAVCFQRKGVITFIRNPEIVIDDSIRFDAQSCSLELNYNDQVLYLAYKNKSDAIVVVRILKNLGSCWESDTDNYDVEETVYDVIEHVVIGEVSERNSRLVYMKDSEITFSLDEVTSSFVPVVGDWLELNCSMQWNDENPTNISANQVLKVKSIRPLRSKIINGIVDNWFGEYGICDKNIYFNRQSVQDGIVPQKGSVIIVEAIESNQGNCSWRATKLITLQHADLPQSVTENNIDYDRSLNLEEELKLQITYPIDFENVSLNESISKTLKICNNSDQTYIINKWIVLNKRKDSQINITPVLTKFWKLHPNQMFTLTVTCQPKFLGKTREHLKILFKGFHIDRYINIQVTNNMISNKNNNMYKKMSHYDKMEKMKEVKTENTQSVIPGVKTLKPANFVGFRLGSFAIPSKIWSAVLGDSEQMAYSPDFCFLMNRITCSLPCLSQPLTIHNYTDKWHTLLYMEEVQQNINMRVYDKAKVFLIRCQEYLAVEITELAEKRPSIIIGDKAIVKDIWDTNAPSYEGYVHQIKGDLVLLKFHQKFHESYKGSDVSLEFHFSRTMDRKLHQAVNFAISKLGPDVLFPSRILLRPPKLDQQKMKSIRWFKENLNEYQKSAIFNILAGECRPLPYCIYGPPGTGKTVTVTELILQILTNFPDSRILVATPSNSAANLITENLIKYRDTFSDSILRLIAHNQIDSENISDKIKPFCSTLNIAEESLKWRQIPSRDLKSNNSPFIGRHRVTIGTCNCLSSLIQLNLPRGHFTHVIVDEAGQATEPEIMTPMVLTDKETTQIILAGDPMQLGPIVISRYCKELGFDESYLSRILETFPYQKDYDAFRTTNGFNPKLVTKLNHNYRSLSEVLELPSKMFYDSSLIAKFDRSTPWVKRILGVISEIFQTADSTTGGIFTYGIRGCNTRAEDSPSWYNPQEASMVALTVCKLYKQDIKPKELGIITPYIAQIKCIRLLFDAMGLPQPKIGTVEEFQGQERPIILISTVRSSESHVQEDLRNALGFVRSTKRLNVALTRAQVAVILFCDPHLLSIDPYWVQVLSKTIENNKYIGCDLPQTLQGHSTVNQ